MRRQDLRVEKFVDYHEIYTDVFNHSEDLILLVKHKHPELNYYVLFVVSWQEPDKTFLPANVLWINFDPNSEYYQKILRRTSKQKSEMFTHSWEPVLLFEELWINQFYDPNDLQLVDIDLPNNATDTEYGLVNLHTENEDSVVIVTTDERLKDHRHPTDHSHDEKPITVFSSDPLNVNVLDAKGTDYIGKALVLNEVNKFDWTNLTDKSVDFDE